MKKVVSMFLAVIMLFSCLLVSSPKAEAAKGQETRAIAIVFDNSGSMYIDGNDKPIKAWCQATYAMEVFASMLNEGDQLLIYPMHPITIGKDGKQEYTMQNPLQITNASKASTIRDIYTSHAGTTPIESIDCAADGLSAAKADKKYMIVLTDGDIFYTNGQSMSQSRTKQELDKRFGKYAGKVATVMYLGIGKQTVMPDTAQSEHFTKQQAAKSSDVRAALTKMCNQIFGRDTLPKNHISGKTIDFDISMNKLIVFVQGANVSDVKVSGTSGTVGTQTATATVKYGTAGCGNYKSEADTSLQGVIVTYEDCTAGSYTIDYKGSDAEIEVYYEPNADLNFIFTDASGNLVDPNELYEGEYKVSFGMMDGETKELIDSDLLGTPKYTGSYSINGKETQFTHEGASGDVSMALKMDDTFDAKLTVTYLSGYTITKDSSDFGWPEGGITVQPKPPGQLKLDISGGEDEYSLKELESGKPFIVKVSYDGTQLTGDALKSVQLNWDEKSSNAKLESKFADDHFEISLSHQDPSNPLNTKCGECSVPIEAIYAAPGSDQTKANVALKYKIKEDTASLKVALQAEQDYIVISELESAKPIIAKLTINGAPLTEEEFKAVKLTAVVNGEECPLTPKQQDSSYEIRLPAKGLKSGDYSVKVTAEYTDSLGRTTTVKESVSITLSTMPLWLKWAIGLGILLLLFLIIWAILHIRVLPKHCHVNKKDSVMIFDGEDEKTSTSFSGPIEKGQLTVYIKYAGTKAGIKMDVTPGKESYLMKSQVKRSASVNSNSVRKFGSSTITEASIGSIKYVLNDDSGKLERIPKSDKPFLLKHGTQVNFSGTMIQAGVQKPFSVKTKLNFKKK